MGTFYYSYTNMNTAVPPNRHWKQTKCNSVRLLPSDSAVISNLLGIGIVMSSQSTCCRNYGNRDMTQSLRNQGYFIHLLPSGDALVIQIFIEFLWKWSVAPSICGNQVVTSQTKLCHYQIFIDILWEWSVTPAIHGNQVTTLPQTKLCHYHGNLGVTQSQTRHNRGMSNWVWLTQTRGNHKISLGLTHSFTNCGYYIRQKNSTRCSKVYTTVAVQGHRCKKVKYDNGKTWICKCCWYCGCKCDTDVL